MKRQTRKLVGWMAAALLILSLMAGSALAFEEQQQRTVGITGFLPYYQEMIFRPSSLDAMTPLEDGVCMVGTVKVDWKFNGEQPWFLRVWIDDKAYVAQKAAAKGDFRLLLWCPNFGNNAFKSSDALHAKQDVNIPPLNEITLKASDKSEANWLRIPYASEMIENRVWVMEKEPVANNQPNRFDWRVLMGVDNSVMRITRGDPQRWQNDWNKGGDMTMESPFVMAIAVDWGLFNTTAPSIEMPLVFQFVTGPEAKPVYEQVLPVTLHLSQGMNMFEGGNMFEDEGAGAEGEAK